MEKTCSNCQWYISESSTCVVRNVGSVTSVEPLDGCMKHEKARNYTPKRHREIPNEQFEYDDPTARLDGYDLRDGSSLLRHRIYEACVSYY